MYSKNGGDTGRYNIVNVPHSFQLLYVEDAPGHQLSGLLIPDALQ